jgi:hypothetical protein
MAEVTVVTIHDILLVVFVLFYIDNRLFAQEMLAMVKHVNGKK